MVSPANQRFLAGRNTTRQDQDWMPRSAITVGIALSLLLVGFALAKLFDKCYRRTELRDDGSDVSDHTRHLLLLQKSTRRGLLVRNRRPAMSEAERRAWQLAVLNMWQNRPAELDDSCQEAHTLMLTRLRNAWLGRRKCGHRDTAGSCDDAGGHGECARRWTPEELQAEVARVARAWLSTARAAAVTAGRERKRRGSSHRAMMRRLSRAWRQRGSALGQMLPIDEAAGSDDCDADVADDDDDGDSYITVAMPDWVAAEMTLAGTDALCRAPDSSSVPEDRWQMDSEADSEDESSGRSDRTMEPEGSDDRYCQIL